MQLRWSDLDALSHVNNVRLMEFLQEARIGLLSRIVGMEMSEPIGQVVARHEVDYLRPLYLSPDPVAVQVRIERIGRSSYTMLQEVIGPDGLVAARARTVLVIVDGTGTASTPIPPELRVELEQYLVIEV